MGPLRFGASRALIALVALAVATGIAAAVPLPEINSQVRGFGVEKLLQSDSVFFFSSVAKKKRDGPLPQFSAPPDFSAPLLQTRSFPRTRFLLPRDGAS